MNYETPLHMMDLSEAQPLLKVAISGRALLESVMWEDFIQIDGGDTGGKRYAVGCSPRNPDLG